MRVQQAKAFRLGAYVRAVPGLFQNTILYPNTSSLFNAMIASCDPTFTWTSLSVQYNLCSPPHRDLSNSGDSMILQLTYNEGGAVWIEQEGGSDYQEVQGRAALVSGTSHSLQGRAILFPARDLLHTTMPWSVFDRVVLAAYTAADWERFSDEVRAALQRVGFNLPPSPNRGNDPVLPARPRAQPTNIPRLQAPPGLYR